MAIGPQILSPKINSKRVEIPSEYKNVFDKEKLWNIEINEKKIS
jgi:hypothetical protein